jgi:hypothetical protein
MGSGPAHGERCAHRARSPRPLASTPSTHLVLAIADADVHHTRAPRTLERAERVVVVATAAAAVVARPLGEDARGDAGARCAGLKGAVAVRTRVERIVADIDDFTRKAAVAEAAVKVAVVGRAARRGAESDVARRARRSPGSATAAACRSGEAARFLLRRDRRVEVCGRGVRGVGWERGRGK